MIQALPFYIPEKQIIEPTGRVFFVGDLHGQLKLLEDALEQRQFDKQRDTLISVGDLIDRGKASLACLGLLRQPWFRAVLGNHERLMLTSLLRQDFGLWYLNGGSWFDDTDRDELSALLPQVEQLPLSMQVQTDGATIGVIHAEPPEDWASLKDAKEVSMSDPVVTHGIESRQRFKQRKKQAIKGIDAVVCGHTIAPEPFALGNVFYIDQGAFHTGVLTVVEAGEVMTAVKGRSDVPQSGL